MKFSNLFRRIRKSLFVIVPLALLGAYSVHSAFSHYTGVQVPGVAELGGCNVGATPGQSCHGAASSSSTVIHLYTPAKIVAGSTDTFRISVSNMDPADKAAGFDVDVDTPAMLQTIPGMFTFATAPFFFQVWSVTHSQPQQFNVNGINSDSAVWSFLYTAPSTPGVYSIYLAGNAVNDDSATADTEDHWNDITQNITVVAPASVVSPASSMNSLQVYPNPASNVLFINDGIPADNGSYTLTDPAGRVVMSSHQIVLDGRHSIDISSMAAGTYILSIQTRDGQSFTRSVVIEK